jgi:CheY-like chemotaxis protein
MLALVVDDSRAMRSILARLLTGLGFDVAQAADGEQAPAVLAAGAHEYVLKPFTDEVIAEKLTPVGVVHQ